MPCGLSLGAQASFENPDIFAPPEVSVRPRAAAHLAAAQRVGNGGEAYQHPTAHGRRTDAHLNHNVLDSNNNRASAAGIQAGGSRLPHAPPSYARKGSVSGSERDPFSPMHEQSLTAHKRQLEERAAEYPEVGACAQRGLSRARVTVEHVFLVNPPCRVLAMSHFWNGDRKYVLSSSLEYGSHYEMKTLNP